MYRKFAEEQQSFLPTPAWESKFSIARVSWGLRGISSAYDAGIPLLVDQAIYPAQIKSPTRCWNMRDTCRQGIALVSNGDMLLASSFFRYYISYRLFNDDWKKNK